MCNDVIFDVGEMGCVVVTEGDVSAGVLFDQLLDFLVLREGVPSIT